MLEVTLAKKGYEVVVTKDGSEAWTALQHSDAPKLCILDWMMPGIDGLELCRKIRKKKSPYVYIIMLTAKVESNDIAAGLSAGADDYITKPFNAKELMARVRVGERILDLHKELTDNVAKLELALSRVKQLQGLLPICSYCKKIRNDQDYWEQVESYLTQHADVMISHGICPDCYQKMLKEIHPA